MKSWMNRFVIAQFAFALALAIGGCTSDTENPPAGQEDASHIVPNDAGLQEDAPIVPPDGQRDSGIVHQDGEAQEDAAPPAEDDTCATATVISTPGTLSGQTTAGYTADYDPGSTCTGYAAEGPDRVYSITVGAGERLTVTVAPDAGYDAAVYLVDGSDPANCTAAPTCLAGADEEAGGGAEMLSWTNSGGSAVTVFIIVDGYGTDDFGGFTLDTAVGTPPAGDSCATAEVIATPGTTSGTTVGFGNDYFDGSSTDGCTSSDSGPDRVYSITVPAGQRLTATLTPVDSGFNPSIYLIAAPASNCDVSPRVCLAADSSATTSSPASVQYLNAGASDQDVLIVIDSDSGAGAGAFTLDTAVAVPPAGDACSTAEAITAPSTTNSTTLDLGNDYSGGSSTNGCTSYDSGPDRVYSITVPNGKVLSATVTPGAGSGYLASVYFIEGPAANCDVSPRVCLAANAGSASEDPVTAFWANHSGGDKSILIVVDGSGSTGGAFALDVTLQDPPAGDSCDTATSIASPGTLTATTVGFINDYNPPAACTNYAAAGPDRVYSITVPAGQRLMVTLTPDAGYDASLYLIDGSTAANCTGTVTCLDGSDGSGPETVSWTNGGAGDATVFIIVDGFNADDYGGFTLDTVVATPPAGDNCATAEATTVGSHAGQTTVGFGNDYAGGSSSNGCTSYDSGPDRVYSITVPAGKVLTATVTPDGGSNYYASVYFVEGPAANCDASPRLCLAADAGSATGEAATAAWANQSGTDKLVFIVVDGYASSSPTGGPFTLDVVIGDPAAGETCATATAIVTPGQLTGQTTVGYIHDYASTDASCTDAQASGPDRVYSISVPAGQKLTVTVTPTTSFDPVLYLVAGPAASCTATPTCLIGADDGGAGTGSTYAETVEWTNSGASAQEVFIIVDGYNASSSGTFTLDTTLT